MRIANSAWVHILFLIHTCYFIFAATGDPESSLHFINHKTVDGMEKGRDKDDWAETAIGILTKKVKKGDLKELEKALSKPSHPTNCVTIPRSSDGRMQVSHRKELPHVMYCRLWRWPDLQSHYELKPLDLCEFAYTRNKQEVCMNPYHYYRIENPMLLPVHVPALQPIPDPTDYLPDMQHTSVTLPDQANYPCRQIPQPIPDLTDYLPDMQHTAVTLPDQASYPCRQPLIDDAEHKSSLIHYEEPPCWSSIAYYELNNRVGDIFYATTTHTVVDGYTDPRTSDRFSLGMITNIWRNSSIEKTRKHIGKGVLLVCVGGEVFAERLSDSPIFVQSEQYSKAVEPTKISSNTSMKIFDNHEFAQHSQLI